MQQQFSLNSSALARELSASASTMFQSGLQSLQRHKEPSTKIDNHNQKKERKKEKEKKNRRKEKETKNTFVRNILIRIHRE